jgi:hypothetical protein
VLERPAFAGTLTSLSLEVYAPLLKEVLFDDRHD